MVSRIWPAADCHLRLVAINEGEQHSNCQLASSDSSVETDMIVYLHKNGA